MAKVVLSRRAENSLNGIIEYYLEKHSPNRAEKVLKSIQRAFTRIARSPESFPVNFDLEHPQENIRHVIVHHTYKIIFRIQPEAIEIIEIFNQGGGREDKEKAGYAGKHCKEPFNFNEAGRNNFAGAEGLDAEDADTEHVLSATCAEDRDAVEMRGGDGRERMDNRAGEVNRMASFYFLAKAQRRRGKADPALRGRLLKNERHKRMFCAMLATELGGLWQCFETGRHGMAETCERLEPNNS